MAKCGKYLAHVKKLTVFLMLWNVSIQRRKLGYMQQEHLFLNLLLLAQLVRLT